MDRIERLIVRKLDGETTADESRELDRVLGHDPGARAMLEEYATIDRLAVDALGRHPMRGPATVATAAQLWATAASAALALLILWGATADRERPAPRRVAALAVEAESAPPTLTRRAARNVLVVPRPGGNTTLITFDHVREVKALPDPI